MVKPSHIYHLNTHELPRRAGEMKEYQLDLIAPEAVGVPLIGVQVGDIIEVDARLEAVTEGILLSAEIYAVATGECIRCLDPVELEIDRTIQELYLYEDDGSNKKSQQKKGQQKKAAPVEDDLEEDEEVKALRPLFDRQIKQSHLPFKTDFLIEILRRLRTVFIL